MIKGKMLGAGQVRMNLKMVETKFPDHVADGIEAEATIEMTEAKKRCPESPGGGDLRDSGKVTMQRHGKTITAVLSFGDAATAAYAIAVHEHLSGFSPPSWVAAEETGGINWTIGGTGPKYLESVLNESRTHMASRIAARVHLDKLASIFGGRNVS